jgi:hypothetical protein
MNSAKLIGISLGLLFAGLWCASARAAEPPALSILLVTDGNVFLEKALAAQGFGASRVIKPADYDAAKGQGTDVSIFDRFTPKQLPKSGGLLFINALPGASDLKSALGADGKPQAIASVTAKSADKEHAVTRQIDSPKFYANSVLKLQVPKDWTVLIDGDKAPLVVARRVERREIVIAFDLGESNWPLKSSFPVFLQQAVQYLGK